MKITPIETQCLMLRGFTLILLCENDLKNPLWMRMKKGA